MCLNKLYRTRDGSATLCGLGIFPKASFNSTDLFSSAPEEVVKSLFKCTAFVVEIFDVFPIDY